MNASIYLLSCALTLGQAMDRADWQLAPKLAPGLELVYVGTYLDESLIPNVQYQKQYRLEASLLVLDARPREWPVAFMTALSLQDPRQPANKNSAGPASVRIEIGQIDLQGSGHGADKKPLDIPLQGPPTLECGFLVNAPLGKVGRNFTWEVAQPGRPPFIWQVLGTENCGGVTCIKVAGVQQSDDWDRGRADQTAWRRRDVLWILPQLNVAQKVERIIERRDPAREMPTQRTVVRYELESRLKYPGKLFEDRREEILTAKKFAEDADMLARRAVVNRPQIEALLKRVLTHLDRPSTTYYRKAFLHVKAVLENARKGEDAVPNPTEEIIAHTVQALNVGERAPDFAVSSLTDEQTCRLHGHQGKAVLVVFYNPATAIGQEVLAFAKDLTRKSGEKVAVMAMAVTQDADLARKQHREMGLPFPILDGNGMRLTFGAEQTPRLVLLDGHGYVRLAQTGWGLHTPYEIRAELEPCGNKER